ncbi:hypothetical protein BOSE62_160199 [Bosea sp. 62]|nr:hypothetical protein BOSE46_10117 [Bosea sp. 46]CAD5248891.1 hypothetical protein BOSE21B_10321 [Bosea sp. 21B]CAD5267249.1 hypothetical protein BOSE7B_150814 [Bosea sp. 7B]VVT45286.1 hypothetical protein BOS5A_10755 [Bosea sp. EC-HK365B]VXA97042.1 hypothetical protein BOSE29B_10115 [Bosea sp. 29B]VXA97651.1 hypothetical protein BOSE125_10115 [Bosea sp. 125]VXB92422.1 hypothetical protein BOSE62_160199 [Bosea sp. 62]VXC55452.1 hypothetical protein BOSE127_190442 [Bosea sp. 127]
MGRQKLDAIRVCSPSRSFFMSALLTYLRRKITGQVRGATDYVASAGFGAA